MLLSPKKSIIIIVNYMLLRNIMNIDKSVLEKDLESAYKTIEAEIETLNILKKSLGVELTKTLEIIHSSKGRVIVTGMGKSGHIGNKIAASMASTGTPAFFVHPAEASHGDLGMITVDDVVIAISNSGESKELVDILNYCKRFGISLIGITKNKASTLGTASTVVLELPNNGEACPLGLAPTNSTTATLVLGDVLTVALMARSSFSKEDFNARHPGGKLGSVLQRVKDLMHVGSDMPILQNNATVEQALIEMTVKRLGCVGFVDEDGKLVGILTDGDLRRCFSKDIIEKGVNEIMTKSPMTINKEIFASEAIRMMNQKCITNIFIVEDEKPIGVIHLHDLLKAGIA